MLKHYFLVLFSILFVANTALAGGCLPGEPCDDTPQNVAPAMEEMKEMEVAPVAVVEDACSGWGTRLSAGVPIWFFQEEGTEVGGGIYLDVYSCCSPVNFRVGAEVNHMDADQPSALTAAEFTGRKANLTFVRIPFAVEYVVPVAERTQLFLGGGPDIINTANDVSDTSVGLHLSARMQYDFNDHMGVALEAGYMWGDVDTNEGGDLDLDNAFIIPSLAYTF